jgi:kynureninase
MALPQRVGGKIGSLIGARPGEVIVADSTSANLYKVLVAALQLRPGRPKIVTDNLNFPSDIYILQGAMAASDEPRRLTVVPSADGIHGPVDELIAAVDEETALLTLSHTVFKSAYTYDMAALTHRAHKAGALVVWDLSHSVGAVPIDLTGAGVDFAVGCTYKYLSGGPGAPAFLYVREALQEQARNPLSGWMGQEEPFAFGLEYVPASGVRRFLTGTPAILSLASIEPGIALLLEAGMEQVRAKSRQQTAFLIKLWESVLAPLDFELRSPREGERRGSHVALGHPEAWRIAQALKAEMKVIPDFRRPDNLRFAVAPLYTSYRELYEAVARLQKVVEQKLYEKYPGKTTEVT